MPVTAGSGSGAAGAPTRSANAEGSRFSAGVSAIKDSLFAATMRARTRMPYRPDSTANFPQAVECLASGWDRSEQQGSFAKHLACCGLLSGSLGAGARRIIATDDVVLS